MAWKAAAVHPAVGVVPGVCPKLLDNCGQYTKVTGEPLLEQDSVPAAPGNNACVPARLVSIEQVTDLIP